MTNKIFSDNNKFSREENSHFVAKGDEVKVIYVKDNVIVFDFVRNNLKNADTVLKASIEDFNQNFNYTRSN